ncbi:MAG TPA: hypothetical protein VMT18_00270 [Planctomycetota bacterium]|nr:hypothetical protein [Planctomycetota bacterium]
MTLISQRKRVLILPRLQWRLVAAFLSAACISTVVQMLLLNLALTRLADETPAARGAVLEAAPDILWTQILLTFGLMVPLVIAVGLLETLRVAGPVHRFEGYLKDVIAGRRPEPCTVRDEDELHDLCRLINAATQPTIAAQAAEARSPEPVEAPSLVAARPAPATVVLD